MIVEVGYTVAWVVIGWMLLRRAEPQLGLVLTCAVALPLGVLAYVVGSLPLLLLGLFHPVAACVLAGVVAGLVAWPARSSASGTSLVGLAVTVVLAGGVAAAAYAINAVAATNDAFWMLRAAQAVVTTGGLDAPPDFYVLRSFPIFVTVVQAVARAHGGEYLVSATTTISYGLLIALARGSWLAARQVGASRSLSSALVVGVALLLASAHILAFQTTYIRGNLEFGLYLGVALVCTWLGATRRETGWLVVTAGGLIGASLLRVEGPILILPALVGVATTTVLPSRLRAQLLTLVAVVVGGWYLLAVLPGAVGIVVDAPTTILLVLALASVPVLVALHQTRARPIAVHASRIVLGGLLLGSILATLLKPAWMGEVAANVSRNAFEPSTGLWGLTWWVLVVAVVAGRSTGNLEERLFAVPVLSYGLLVYVSGFFNNIPHKLGWASSANRMFTGVVFAAAVWGVLRVANLAAAPTTPERRVVTA